MWWLATAGGKGSRIMSFDQLRHVSRLVGDKCKENSIVFEWEEKRKHLLVWVKELPRLVEEYKKATKTPYELNPMITLRGFNFQVPPWGDPLNLSATIRP